MFSSSWGNASLSKAIDKFAPGAKGELNAKGTKTIYKNNITGIHVVHDNEGNYFRYKIQIKRVTEIISI